MLWFERRQRVPLLVGSLPDSMVNTPDGTSSPATPLYPTNGRIDFRAISGLSARVGGRVNDQLGFDIGGFVLERSTIDRSFSSPGSPSLIRTYIQPTDTRGINLFFAKLDPNGYAGSIRVQADSELYGIDGHARTPWYHVFADRSDLLVGLRYINLNENLNITSGVVFPEGSTLDVADNFRARNHIYAGQVGFQSYWSNNGRFDLNYFAKLGVGGASQRVEISGSNSETGSPDEASGLYVQPSNAGVYERTKFVMIGEIGFKLGYRFTERVHAQVGYNILYVSSVVRPGLALDPVVNDANIRFVAEPVADPINRRPAFDFSRASSDFYAQGLTVGFTIQY